MSNREPVLQVALDFEHIFDAEKMAMLLEQELSDVRYICEAGTPLIKNEGLKTVIPRLRAVVGAETKIVADLKTMDTGAFEVELARNAGADIVSIAGASEEETIEAAFAKAKSLGIGVMVDSISTMKISGRLEAIGERMEKYIGEGGRAILEYHIPIDAQTKTGDFSMIREMRNKFNIPVAAAGGLDENTIPKVLAYGASVCVIGGTITRPKQRTAEEAIRKIKEAVYGLR